MRFRRCSSLHGRALLIIGGVISGALAGPSGCSSDTSSGTEPPPPSFDAAELDARLEAVADDAVQQTGVRSFVLRVDAPCLDYSFETARGIANEASSEAMTPDHAFWIASTTKTMTAVAILQLVERGELSLDDTLIDHLPAELVDRVHVVDGVSSGRDITVDQLIGHTSGLWDHASDGRFFAGVLQSAGDFWSPPDLVEWAIENGDPVGPPGAQYHYSDFGYLLAGLIVESVTGKPIHEVYRESIFGPLDMTSAYQGGYEDRPDVPVAGPFFTEVDIVGVGIDPSFDWAGGGVIATAEDLNRFYAGLFSGRLLTEPSLTLLLEGTDPDLPGRVPGRQYGLGIQRPLDDGADWRGHGGFWGSWAGHSPARNVTVAYSTSQSEVDNGVIKRAIFEAIPDLTCNDPGYRPIFEPEACPFEPPGNADRLDCGRVRVPLRRDQRPTKLIDLATIVQRTSPEDRRPDPLVFLMGGPGGHAISTILPFLPSAGSVVNGSGRDFVAFDQRGTGYSDPDLSCGLRIEPGNEDAYAPAIAECAERFVDSGVDLGAFSTVENAHDVDDVRRALGAEAWNLYGVSYGSTLALSTLRLHPEGTRTVVLDSPGPPQELFFENFGRYAQASLDAVLAACAADESCADRYPDLGPRFGQALESLEGSEVPPELVAETIRLLLYDTFALPSLPRVIDSVARGDLQPLRDLDSVSSDFSSGDSDGMGLSVVCREWAPILSLEELTASHLDLGAPFAEALLPRQRARYEACAGWPSGRLDLAERDPVQSDVPTLILVGQYDPVTPRESATMAVSSLSNAQVVEFPGVGHAVVPTGLCPMGTILTFLDAPMAPVPTACVESEYGAIQFE